MIGRCPSFWDSVGHRWDKWDNFEKCAPNSPGSIPDLLI